MEVKRDKEGEAEAPQSHDEDGKTKIRTGKSCNGALYYSSLLKSKGRNPLCVGFTRSLHQVPNHIISETEVEASKEEQSLTDFKYACVGHSVYLDNKNTPSIGDQKGRAELPVCVGIQLVVDKRPVDSQATVPVPAPSPVPHAHNKEDQHRIPQPRTQKPNHPAGDEFYSRFTRNAGLVASGVVRNMRKVGNYVKESVDDILFPYRRPRK